MSTIRPRLLNTKQSRVSLARGSSEHLHLGLHCQRAYGLTLIELLVVIVILTTLVAGVVPLLSPNNDTRKIREASRGLQSYITMAQSKAARTGRPAGIAFRESAAGSGVALEVFQLEVPKRFAGFSEDSRARVTNITGMVGTYGGALAQYDGFDLYEVSWSLAGGGGADPLPPRMFRLYDEIVIDGNRFLIVDHQRNEPKLVEYGTPPNVVRYFGNSTGTGPASAITSVTCIWLNHTGQLPPQNKKSYHIVRQPKNSSESPFQLPAGVVIDMQGSVMEGDEDLDRFPTAQSLFAKSLFELGNVNTFGIMFSPTGSVSNIFLNGNRLTAVSRVVLLLGRIENAGIDPLKTPWVWQTGVEIEEIQAKINWLNLDSRLLSIVSRSGRTVVSELAFVDPSLIKTAALQIEAAHQFGHEMKRGGGG